MCNEKEEVVLNEIKKSQELYTLSDARKWGRKVRFKLEIAIFNYVTRYLEEGATILEIGPGRGEFAKIAREKGFRYIGIEPSATMRTNLVERGFEILSDPVPPINLKDESVEMVHSNNLIEHLENYTTVLKYFRESRRVLKKGGIMSSVIPNCDTIGMIFYLLDYQHNFVTNRRRLEHLSRDTGFKVIASRHFLTKIGLSSFSFLDRIFAHVLLLFMRSPLIYSIICTLGGYDISFRIYKNLFDKTVVISRKLQLKR